MKNKYDVPPSMMALIKEHFDMDETVIEMRAKQRSAILNGDYHNAAIIGETLKRAFEKVVQSYMEESEKGAEKIELSNMKIPQADKDEVMAHAMVMFMACDLIESAVMNVDDILHKYDKTLNFEMFNDFRNISQLAKEKLKFFHQNTDYMASIKWGDKCDDMYEMALQKCRSIGKWLKDKKD